MRGITGRFNGVRGGLVALSLLAVLVALAAAPFLFPGTRSVDTAARICIFIVLAASYDLMLGYAGIVSFAHMIFFGMGAYGVALASTHLGREAGPMLLGAGAGALVAAVIAVLIGLFSLRVRAIFFAMITLAVASTVVVLVGQFPGVTGGEDGLTFAIPRFLTPAMRFAEDPVFGVAINGRLACYYLVFGVSLLLFLILRRIVGSPFGRVLQAIRENEFRAEAIGYSVLRYRVGAICISAIIASLAGSLYALWLRYVGPGTVLGFDIMIDVLLMVVIGGMGTLHGAVLGAALLLLAQNYLPQVMGWMSAGSDVPILTRLLDPDRWLLWLGVVFVLSVYFFPAGIVGRRRAK